jgi:hypothetical protein
VHVVGPLHKLNDAVDPYSVALESAYLVSTLDPDLAFKRLLSTGWVNSRAATTREAGKCFDFCPITEFSMDQNHNYSNASKVETLKAMNIGNFVFQAMQGWFKSEVGEAFAKEAFGEYSDEECADEDNECERGDDDDDDDQGQQGGPPQVVTKTTPAGCSVNSSSPMFSALFNITAPKQ